MHYGLAASLSSSLRRLLAWKCFICCRRMSHRGAETRPARLEIWPRPLAPQTAQPPKPPAVDSSHLVEHDHLKGLPEPEKNQGSPPRRAPRSKPPLGCCSSRLRRSRGPCSSMPQHVLQMLQPLLSCPSPSLPGTQPLTTAVGGTSLLRLAVRAQQKEPLSSRSCSVRCAK